MGRTSICLFLVVVAAVVGPRLFGPRGRAAGAPFEYVPPAGFVLVRDAAEAGGEDVRVWLHEDANMKNFDGSLADSSLTMLRVILSHSSKEMSVEEVDLAKLVEEMPKAFEGSCVWSHRRHEMRTRADGARVGLIEGDCERARDSATFGLRADVRSARKLQLMFPDDAGTSIVTISYPVDQAARWEPLFEETIVKARGVATRVPSAPWWVVGAWAAAAAVLGWLATAIFVRRQEVLTATSSVGLGSEPSGTPKEDREPAT